MLRTLGGILAAFLMVAAFGYAQGEGEGFLLEVKGKYGDVPFPHLKHQEDLNECNACHALFPKERGGIERMKARAELKKKAVMNQCRSCHKERLKDGHSSGPVRCFDCHLKGG